MLQRHRNQICLCHTFVASSVTLNKSPFSTCVSSVNITDRLMEKVESTPGPFMGADIYGLYARLTRQIRMTVPKSERRRHSINGITTIQLGAVTKKMNDIFILRVRQYRSNERANSTG